MQNPLSSFPGVRETHKNTPSSSFPSTRPSSWWVAGIFVVGCEAIGFLGSLLGGAFKKQPWYDESPKPAVWPPQWVFPLVWIGNYLFMGIAAWQVWRRRHEKAVQWPLGLFSLHLLHNFSFIPIVYRLKRQSVYVLMDTIGLFSGLITTRAFVRVSRPAGWWMLPYLCWLGFTTSIKVLWWRLSAKKTR
jgi:benzodiazapine receptor